MEHFLKTLTKFGSSLRNPLRNPHSSIKMAYIFTSESVSEGHPDKIADQISDALLDHFLAFDPQAKVACETLVTTGQVVLAGEVKTSTYIDVQQVARSVIKNAGYDKEEYQFSADSCGVLSAIHEQSPDISQGVVKKKITDQGAGDQGIMFGYASDETEHYMPLALALSHRLLRVLADLRKKKTLPYLRPDAKAQVSVAYDEQNLPLYVDTIVISTQHDPFDDDEERMLQKIREDIKTVLIPKVLEGLQPKERRLFGDKIAYHINPTGRFVIGGPHGDTGLTGRKIIVDTYGGKGAHGGGAFSGKDPSKVDRSAAYAARHLAKNFVAAGGAQQVLIQLSYAIGVSNPISFHVNTYGSAKIPLSDVEIGKRLQKLFSLTPHDIEKRLNLRQPMYLETAVYGHMGRLSERVSKHFSRPGAEKRLEVELFTWEKLDCVDDIQKLFGLPAQPAQT